MEIDGRSLEKKLEEVRRNISSAEAQGFPEYIRESRLRVDILKEEEKYLELIQLTEEKRRLLTIIIELLETASHEARRTIFPGVVMSDFQWLVDRAERINSAKTMKELEFFDTGLSEYKASKEKSNELV